MEIILVKKGEDYYYSSVTGTLQQGCVIMKTFYTFLAFAFLYAGKEQRDLFPVLFCTYCFLI